MWGSPIVCGLNASSLPRNNRRSRSSSLGYCVLVDIVTMVPQGRTVNPRSSAVPGGASLVSPASTHVGVRSNPAGAPPVDQDHSTANLANPREWLTGSGSCTAQAGRVPDPLPCLPLPEGSRGNHFPWRGLGWNPTTGDGGVRPWTVGSGLRRFRRRPVDKFPATRAVRDRCARIRRDSPVSRPRSHPAEPAQNQFPRVGLDCQHTRLRYGLWIGRSKFLSLSSK